MTPVMKAQDLFIDERTNLYSIRTGLYVGYDEDCTEADQCGEETNEEQVEPIEVNELQLSIF